MLRDPVRDQRGTRHLDHGAHRVGDLPPRLRHHLLRDPVGHLPGQLHLRHRPGERDHDLGLHRHTRRRHLAGRLHDGPHLHVVDLGERDAEPAAAMAQHRVGLDQRLQAGLDRAQLGVPLRVEAAGVEPRVFLEHLLVLREELVERRVQQPDRHRVRGHHPEDADEIFSLERQQLVDRFLPGLDVAGHDHLAHDRDALVPEEHVLGAHQADAHRAELAGLDRVRGSVGIGADRGGRVLLGPAQELPELVGELGVDERLGAHDHLAGGAVERDHLPLADDRAPGPEEMVLLVHHHVARAHHAALAPAAGDHRRVRREAAPRGQHALGRVHARHILRGGFGAHQDDRLFPEGHVHRRLGIEDDLAHRRRRGGGEALGDRGIARGRVDRLHEELVERSRLHAQQRGVPVDAPLLDHLHRDADRRRRGALARSGLQDEEPPVLDGELDVLHVAVVALQPILDRGELGVHRGHPLLERVERLRGADARHHVLALGIDEELAEEPPLPARGVAREAHAGARGRPEIAEDHGHHGHRGAPVVGQPVDAPVVHRLLGPPGLEDRVDRQPELLVRVLREGPARLVLHDLLELRDQLPQGRGREIGIRLGVGAGLRGVQPRVEGVAVDGEHHVPEERHEAAVAVPREALVPGPGREPLHRLVVEAQVEDRVHHPGHRGARPRPDRHQQRPRRVTQAAARGGLEAGQMSHHLPPEPRRMLLAACIVRGPRLGGDGEAGRNRHAHLGHLGQLAAFAAEQVAQRARAFRLAAGEGVDVLGLTAGFMRSRTRGGASRAPPTPGLRHHRTP